MRVLSTAQFIEGSDGRLAMETGAGTVPVAVGVTCRGRLFTGPYEVSLVVARGPRFVRGFDEVNSRGG